MNIKYLHIFLSLLLATLIFSSNELQASKLRIGTYNIWNSYHKLVMTDVHFEKTR